MTLSNRNRSGLWYRMSSALRDLARSHRHFANRRVLSRNIHPITRLEILEDRALLSGLHIVFDYSLDTRHFFDTDDKKAVLEAAADVFTSRFVNDLLPITPGGSNTWTPVITNPGTGGLVELTDLSVPVDTVIVYVGARDLAGPLGTAQRWSYSASGSIEWLRTIASRAPVGPFGGMFDTGETDFLPGGGTLTFDSSVNWHISTATDGLENDEFDLLSVATHELTHMLGFSQGVPAFAGLISDGTFIGPLAEAEYDATGPVPLADGSHWSLSVTENGQDTLMQPVMLAGTRRPLTSLDLAALEDIGWIVADTGPNSAPTDLNLSASAISEDVPLQTTVGLLSTVDPDLGDTFTYSLVEGAGADDNGAFTIDGNALQTNTLFDFDTQSSYHVRIRTTDAGGLSFEREFVIEVTAADGRPELDLNGELVADVNYSAGFLVGGASVALVDPQELSISDPDSAVLTGAVVTITNLQDGSLETLSVDTQDLGISADYDSQTGTLTLSGSADLDSYERVLRTVRYANSASQPGTTSRVISFTVFDVDGHHSTPVTTTLAVIAATNWPTFYYANQGEAATGPSGGTAIGVDGDGNTYVAGYFSGTMDFAPGSAVASLAASGTWNMFLAKYSPQGSLTWVRQVTGANTLPSALAVDDQGQITVVGTLQVSANFEPATSDHVLESVANLDGFIARWDSDGQLLWARAVGGSGYIFPNDVAVSSQGAVLVTGSFTQGIDFDPGAGVHAQTSLGGHDAYVLKLDSAGDFQWVQSFAAVSDVQGEAIALDTQGNLYVAGNFGGTVDFDPGAGVVTAAGGINSTFLVKLNAAGEFDWLRNFSGARNFVRDLAVDSAGNVITVGSITGTTDFDRGTGVVALSPVGVGDVYVTRHDTNGNLLWARSFGAPDFDLVTSVALDESGSTYIAGSFNPTADFDPGPGGFHLESAGGEEIYISKLSVDGQFEWAVRLGGSDTDRPNDIAVDADGNVLTTGYFGDSSQSQAEYSGDFDPGIGQYLLQSPVEETWFLSKLSQSGALPNQAPTDLTLSNTSVPESNAQLTTIGALQGLDPDGGETFTYALVAGTGDADNGRFLVDGNQLILTGTLDFESLSTFLVRLRVTDSGGLTFDKAFVISVTNVNESPSNLTLNGDSVEENQPAGAVVGTLQASDPDAGDTLTFQLVTGPGDEGNADFVIVGNELRLAHPLDFETQQVYSVRVRVADPHGAVLDQVFSVNVLNVNKSVAPEIQQVSATINARRKKTVAVAGSASLIDDSSTFAAGKLTISITAGAQSGDILGLLGGRTPDGAKFKLIRKGTQLVVGKQILADVVSSQAGTQLEVTFRSGATRALAELMLRSLSFKGKLAGERTLQLVATDPDGLTSAPATTTIQVQ